MKNIIHTLKATMDLANQSDPVNKPRVINTITYMLVSIIKEKEADDIVPGVLKDILYNPLYSELTQEALSNPNVDEFPLKIALNGSKIPCVIALLDFPDARKTLDVLFEHFLQDPDLNQERLLYTLLHQRSSERFKTINPYDLFKTLTENHGTKIHFNQLIGAAQRSILHFAAMCNELAVIELCLNKGLDPHFKDTYGFTPLDYALFNGNLSIAEKLSNKSAEQLEEDPRFNNPPPRMDHGALIKNMLAYIEIKQKQDNKLSTNLTLPYIDNGICNGWSMEAALEAALSAQTDENIQRFYKVMDVLCKWDKSEKSLQQIPKEFKTQFSSLDQMFHQLFNEIYWFFHLSSDIFMLAFSDREMQLEAISDNTRVKRIADFGLSDLTQDELIEILKAYQKIANNTIINVYSCEPQSDKNAHCTFHYQKSYNNIYYFDPNPEYALPAYANYEESTKKTLPFLTLANLAVNSVSYFYVRPEHMPKNLIEQADQITDDLIQKLIIDKRMKDKSDIRKHINAIKLLKYTIAYGNAHLLDRLINHSPIKKLFDAEMIIDNVNSPIKQQSPCFYVIYQHGIDVNELKHDALIAFLKTAIQYNDQDMLHTVKIAINALALKEKRILTPEEHKLLAFKLPENNIRPPAILGEPLLDEKTQENIGQSQQKLPINKRNT